jgi:hypothetical protein
MSNITEVYKAVKKLGDGGGEIVTIMPNERCSTMSDLFLLWASVFAHEAFRFALTSGGSLVELKVVGGDRQW